VGKEAARLGVQISPDDEAAYNAAALQMEQEEFRLATRLLCPSEFVVRTLLDKGLPLNRLARHIYGFDDKVFYPKTEYLPNTAGLKALFVGVGSVRKGVHFAMEAWLKSPACKDGTFTLAGKFFPEYSERLAPMLAHPSVRVVGQRNDIPDLMRDSDILMLPSLEEGFGLVCTEAMGSGCVPLVSDACTDLCRHGETALVHKVGDVDSLAQHITLLHEDRKILQELRSGGLRLRPSMTWKAAGVKLLDAYRETLAMHGTNIATYSPAVSKTA
jgi:glycosyltransferase involved in cell wall biosynthesis